MVRAPASAGVLMFRPNSYVAVDGVGDDGVGGVQFQQLLVLRGRYVRLVSQCSLLLFFELKVPGVE